MKILLIGWFGAGNVGDEAILVSEIQSLHTLIKECELYVLSFGPERTARLTSSIPEVKRILRIGSKLRFVRSDFVGILRAFREVDAVIVGGGGIFQDIYNHYPIPFFTAMVLLARLHRKRTVLYSVGIGPVRGIVGRRLCRVAANAADLVSVRDRESLELLAELAVTGNVRLSADPVFLLEPARSQRAEEFISIHGIGQDRPTLGVCVQDLLAWDDGNKRALAGALDEVVGKWKAHVVFLPLGAYHDAWFLRRGAESVDVTASRRVGGFMQTRCPILDADELNPRELLTVLERFDAVISMRLHGAIMALAMGTPVLALTYPEEVKIRSVMRRLGLEEDVFDVTRLEKGLLVERIHRVLAKAKEARQVISAAVGVVKSEAEECNRSLIRSLVDGVSAA